MNDSDSSASAMAPVISVVMPMRNAEGFVQEALGSVLVEREVAIEVVVVDDGSTDASRARVLALGDPRVRVIDGPQRGFAASLSTGLRAARGTFVTQCDADDRMPAGRLAHQLAWLNAHPDHAAVCAAYSTIDTRGRDVANMMSTIGEHEADIHPELRQGVVRTSFCTYLTRRAVFDQIGYFREYFETSPDIDFQLRLGEQFKVGYQPFNSYFYRLHDSSITHTQANVRRVFFEEICHRFQAQRQARGSDDLMDGHPPEPPAAQGAHGAGASSQVHGMLVGQAWRVFQAGQTGPALRLALRAVQIKPQATSAWRALLLISMRGALRSVGLARSSRR